MSTAARKAVINARIAPDHAAELRHRAEQHETTVSRIVAGIIRRALTEPAAASAPGRKSPT